MSYNVRRRLCWVQVFPDTKQLQLLDRFDIMGVVDINGSGSGVVMCWLVLRCRPVHFSAELKVKRLPCVNTFGRIVL